MYILDECINESSITTAMTDTTYLMSMRLNWHYVFDEDIIWMTGWNIVFQVQQKRSSKMKVTSIQRWKRELQNPMPSMVDATLSMTYAESLMADAMPLTAHILT